MVSNYMINHFIHINNDKIAACYNNNNKYKLYGLEKK